jgi:hypothetical protein
VQSFEVKHAATNFCICADTGFVDFVELIDNNDSDDDDVLLNDLLAFIDITPAPADPDRDLEASTPLTSQRASRRQDFYLCRRFYIMGSPAYRCGDDSTTSVTLGDNLIFNLVVSTNSDPDRGDGGVGPDERPLLSAPSLIVVEVLAPKPAELSPAFPTEITQREQI